MSDAETGGYRPVQSIFHPSDFSQASEVAFAHALKIALVVGGELNMLHVSPKAANVTWTDFPGVRETLERWRLIPENSERGAVAELGIDVRKVVTPQSDPVRSALGFLKAHPTDLIVLATHQHDGTMRWLRKSVAEPLARESGQMTLFIPHGVQGFVSRTDGSLSLRRIIVPIDKEPRPQPAIDAAARAAEGFGLDEVVFTLVYVGEQGDMPAVHVHEKEGWTWKRTAAKGEPVEMILKSAADTSADLIIMATTGRSGFLDALRGSTTERVLRGAPCPLLALPAV